jgi:hypothetical protein
MDDARTEWERHVDRADTMREVFRHTEEELRDAVMGGNGCDWSRARSMAEAMVNVAEHTARLVGRDRDMDSRADAARRLFC